MSFTEVHDAINFALATLGGASNQGDACNALRGAKVVLHRLEATSNEDVLRAAGAQAINAENLTTVLHCVTNQREEEKQSQLAPVPVPDSVKALIAEGASTNAAPDATVAVPATPAIVVQTAPHESLAEKIEHAVEGALGIAPEPQASQP